MYVYNVTMFTTCLDFGSWTWVISALDCRLHGCSRYGVRLPWLCVRMLSLYATGWPVFSKCIWYVTSMLCCHCWMFSLSDALPMQSYPSKVWVLCQCGITYICLVSCRSMFLHEIGGILWLALWRCWLHSCRMLRLLVEYGLVHRGDCINCETCYFCFDPAFVWPSLGRADFNST